MVNLILKSLHFFSKMTKDKIKYFIQILLVFLDLSQSIKLTQ